MSAAPENPGQAAAIGHAIDAPLRIAAGPGTGKTYVLAHRYLHLLTTHGLAPRQILALTFTNRAAAEMRERVARYALAPPREQRLLSALDLSDAWIGTFHGVCLRILQENTLAAGLPATIAAIDEEQKRRLRTALRERFLSGSLDGGAAPPDPALLLDLAEDAFWRGLWETIDKLQDAIVTPAAFMEAACRRAQQQEAAVVANLAAQEATLSGAKLEKERQTSERARRDYAELPAMARVVEQVYRAYQDALRQRGALDFPGQISAAYQLLTERPDVRARYRAQFRHILVDEVQDTSLAQMRLIEALAADGMANVTIIGDRKQSIYAWRGARPRNLEYVPIGPGGQATLLVNYRSPQAILDVAAAALEPLTATGQVDPAELQLQAASAAPLAAAIHEARISESSAPRNDAPRETAQPNSHELPTLKIEPGSIELAEPPVSLAGPAEAISLSAGRRAEAAYIARRVRALLAGGRYQGQDIVILLRSVAAAAVYEDALRQAGVPTLVIGGKGFYGRPEVRDALALLRAAVNPLDDAALVRVVQSPLCGLHDVAVTALARHGGYGHLYDGLARAATLPFSLADRDEVARRATALLALLERVGRRLEGLPLPDLLWGALEESCYLDYANTRPGVERERLLANLEKLRRAAASYAATQPLATAASFARRLSYLFDEEIDEAEESIDAGPDVVRLMTVHQAKGNEFPVVIVADARPRPPVGGGETPAMAYDEDMGFVVLKRCDQRTLETVEAADSVAYKEARKKQAMEEERYVWFVALTRAQQRLILTTPHCLATPPKKTQEWPLQELYRQVRGDAPPAALARAVVVETLDDAPEPAPDLHAGTPDEAESTAILTNVRVAAELAAQPTPPIAAPPRGPISLSYSALRTYRACPRRYQLRYELGLPPVPLALRPPAHTTPAYDTALLGAAVHAALERHPDPRAATLETLLGVFRASCRARGLAAGEIERVYAPRARPMLELYLRGAVARGQAQRVYAELAVLQLLGDGPIPVHLVGRIDRVALDGDGWLMVDYKTHRALAPADVEEAGLQLRLYKAAWQAGAARALGEEAGDPRLYVYEAASGTLHEVDGGPRALEAAVHLLCDVAAKIAADDFAVPPDYEPPCAGCDFGGPYGLCPDRRNRSAPGDPEAALAGEVFGARRYDHGADPGQYPMLGPNALGEDQGPIPDATGEQAATPTGAPCFICAMTHARCARAYVSGTLRAVREAGEGYSGYARVLLAVEQGVDEQRVDRQGRGVLADEQRRELWLELAPPWHSLVPTLQDVLASGASVRLAAYHLARGTLGERPSYRAIESSLVALDPDTLIDVTAIARAEYCARKSLIDDLASRGASASMAEGSAVHVAFARGLQRGEPPLDHLEAALNGAAASLALAADGDDSLTTRERLEEHLRRAGDWLEAHPRTGRVRTEALLLSPGLGLRGRADAIFDPDGRPVALDLKTGRSDGPDPRREHALQLAAYTMLLRERGRDPLPGWLLYTGNPAGDTGRRVSAGMDDYTTILRLRNDLAAIALLGRAPLSPYRGRCLKCPVIAQCRTLSFLNGETPYALGTGAAEARAGFSERDAAFFQRYNALLRLEGRAAGASVRALWQQTAERRVERGVALDVAGAGQSVTPQEDGAELWRFTLENRSELREGDVVLLGDGDPIMGEAEQGVVELATAGELAVRLRGALAVPPRLVDRYAVDSGWQRGLRTLWRWMAREAAIRELVAGSAAPRFDPLDQSTADRSPAAGVADGPLDVSAAGMALEAGAAGDSSGRSAVEALNARQRRAIALALAARGYLLVQGPPGAGKTSTIAHMARALRGQGRRVLLASFTNRAVDAMLEALEPEQRAEAVRLGGETATSAEQRALLLARRAAAEGLTEPAEIAARLDSAGIVAATVATLAAAGYDGQRFDMVIVDEASQLTVPDVLAALRLARRFVLVGDDRQLPPVVQSDAATQITDEDGQKVGLDVPLFTLLQRRLIEREDGAGQREDGIGLEAPYVVMLEEQYRMNAEICAFPSVEWYGGKLQPGTLAVARGRLRIDLGRVEALPADTPSPHAQPAASALSRLDTPQLRAALDPARPVVFRETPLNANDAPHTSRAEAERVRDLCAGLLAGGVAARSIGVIAPYRAQVALIRNLLREAGLGAIVADTVDRFQGSQRDAMLLSFSGDAGKERHLLHDERRLNVALTRARHKLILLGPAAEPGSETVYARLLDAVSESPLGK